LILVVCISNGEYEKQQNGKYVYTCVFDVFNIQSYSQTTKSISLNWQHAAIVEYVMLKLVSNVPPFRNKSCYLDVPVKTVYCFT
jgi:hypothetical protein